MRINTNVSAIIANHHLNKTDNMLSQSMQRLSSGLRLNRAEDDSAAIAIAKRMHTQVESISQTGRNGNDGVSVVQTAEGALNEVHSMLQRMRELAVQGANGTNSDEDRAAIQEEVENLKEEIVRISGQTQFGNITLLDGSLDRRSYCKVTPTINGVPSTTNENTSSWGRVLSSTDSVPADVYGIKVTEEAKPAELEFKVSGPVGVVPKDSEGTVKINGVKISIEEGDTKGEIETKMMEVASKIGATYKDGKFTTEDYGSAAKIEIEFSNNKVQSLFTTGTNADGTEIKPQTNPIKANGSDVKVTLDNINGTNREGFSSTASWSTERNYVTITDNNGFNMVVKVSKEGTYLFDVTDMGTMPIQIGIAEGQILDIRIPTVDLETLDLIDANCGTQDGCESAIVNLDKAISYISSVRSGLGAYQNRLESAVRSIEVAEESATGALSQIEDTDMAEEMTYYTQMNVLTQAGVSVLAQANERPQMVLQLLQ